MAKQREAGSGDVLKRTIAGLQLDHATGSVDIGAFAEKEVIQ
jgi:hypothetical protein